MALKVAARGSVPPFIVMDVLREANERAAAGEDVLHLEVGQPGTPAPEAVLAAEFRLAVPRDILPQQGPLTVRPTLTVFQKAFASALLGQKPDPIGCFRFHLSCRP